MIHGSLNLHNIVDIDITTEMNPSSTVYDADGKGSPCKAFKMTRVKFISNEGEAFEVLAFRSNV